MNFKDILNLVCGKTEVYFGYDDTGAYKVDLKSNPSVIITGSTGTSKSVMINQILLQLINKNNFDELKIVSINPTKVELKPYRITKYAYNKEITLECDNFSGILNMIQNRIDLFKEYSVNNYEEYNSLNYKENLPLIIIAIDEATFLFNEENSDEKLKWIIENCKKTGIILLLTTNDLYNDFFKKGYNTFASIRISFDFVSNEDAKLTNLSNCDKLKLDEFLLETSETTQRKFNTFFFEDETIHEILK